MKGGGEAWWAESRERVLLPYYQDIRGWVKKCADRGWGCNTPNYLLSESCFELMLGDDKCDGSSVKIVLDRDRYNEVWRRSERKSLVLRMIDRESFKMVGESCAEIPEGVMTFLYGVAELRKLVVRASTYVLGLPKLYVLYFNLTPEAVLDMMLSIDSPKSRLNALVETMKAAVECGRVRVFLPFLPVVLESLASCRDLNDQVLRLLVDVLVSIGSAVNDSEVNGFDSFDLERWINGVQVYAHRGGGFLSLSSSLKGADEVSEDSRMIAPFWHAEEVAERIEDSRERARALVRVADALAQVGETDRARQVADNAASTAERIEKPWLRAQALAVVAEVLAQVGETDRARRVADNAASTAERIEEPQERAWFLAEVAEALARVGETDRARQVADNAASTAERIEKPRERVRALTGVAEALAQAGAIDGALKIVSVMNDPISRSRALSPVIKDLVRKGSSDDAVEAMRAELGWVRGVAERRDAAGCYATLAEACADVSDLVDSESTIRGQWLGLARSALACSWLYGESVWDQFGILMRVAPELAVQLVDERILAEPEGGTPPESDPDLGYEGPGGEAGSYR